jgi:Na+/H+ antiporter NhaD/arsenite permease-like protein
LLNLRQFSGAAFMTTLILVIFIIGYVLVMFEHKIKIDKAGSALVTGILCWAVYAIGSDESLSVNGELMHHLSEIASIIFFLTGAMTIVELIAAHDGFTFITNAIKTTSKVKLLWIITLIAFFLSAVLDNLTTAIVMTSICGKILNERIDRLWFAGMIIIAANAGGAWSPLGDVTTTMLWIGNQVTAANIIKALFLPSLAVSIVPLLIVSVKMKGQSIREPVKQIPQIGKLKRDIIFFAGIGLLLFVPVFKTITHLPPFMGIMLALGILWFITSYLHSDMPEPLKEKYSISSAMEKIDTPGILFFLGILLAVAALDTAGILNKLADYLQENLKNDYLIGTALGLLSALVDNVPLVAATQGMYDLSVYATDHPFWNFIALTTGTGGSALIIGSAAGVAVMGIEKIDFVWYLKKITLPALTGFAAGILVFLAQLSG